MIDGMLGGCLHRLGGSVQPVAVEKKGNNGMMGIGKFILFTISKLISIELGFDSRLSSLLD